MTPCTWTMEGSVDGAEWTVLDEVFRSYRTNDVDNVQSSYRWNSNNESISSAPDPRPISGRSAVAAVDLPNATVSVAPGATLEAVGAVVIDKLAVDAGAGVGSLSGVAFAETGTVDITNLSDDEAVVAADFSGAEGYENLANWTVRINGVATHRYKLRVTDSSIRLERNGFSLIIR